MGKYNKGASTNIYYIISDCVFATIAFIAAAFVSELYLEVVTKGYIGVLLSFLVIYVLSGKDTRIYNITTFFYLDRFIRKVTMSFGLAGIITWLLLQLNGTQRADMKFIILFLMIGYPFLLSSSILMHYIFRKYFTKQLRTAVIGYIPRYEKFIRFLDKSSIDFNLVGYISIDKNDTDGYLGYLDDLDDIIHNNAIDQVYVMIRQHGKVVDAQSIIDTCMEMGVTTRVIVNSYHADGAQSYVSSVGTYPIVTYHTVSLNKSARFIKRAVDIMGSMVGIILFSPVMIITALAIKIDSRGPIIFKQKRVGMNGRYFYIFKFRSMCMDAEVKKKELMNQNQMQGGFMFKMKDDPRITRVGKFIRKTSIDELPQFFNVLIGEMSLVGTRPPTIDEVERYKRNHWRRMSIKPGITGMWQISGRSNLTDFDEIVELDTAYIDRWGIMVDFKIMLQTVIQLFRHKGAF